MNNVIVNPYVYIYPCDESNSILFNSDSGALCLLDNFHLCGNELQIASLSEQEVYDLAQQNILLDNSESDMLSRSTNL